MSGSELVCVSPLVVRRLACKLCSLSQILLFGSVAYVSRGGPTTVGGSGDADRSSGTTHRRDSQCRAFLEQCMPTRSGASYKRTEPLEETMSDTEEGADTAPRESAGVADLVRLLLEDRRKREDELAAERAQPAEETRKHETQMKEQLDMIRSLVECTRTGSGSSGDSRRVEKHGSVRDKLVLTKLSEEDDIEAYLTTFERMMTMYSVEEGRWAIKLAPQLTG